MTTTAADAISSEHVILRTVLENPGLTLNEIANKAHFLAPHTYDVVSRLRTQDLLQVAEIDGSRYYSITDAGREILGVPSAEAIAAADQEEREEDRLQRSHSSALKRTEPLAEFPHALKEPEQRELVLQAIREKYLTLDGIKRRVGFPMWFDMTELLAGMTIDYLIRKEFKGDLTAYFLYEDKPLKFWRIGDGRIDFEKDPNFMPRDEQAKAEELGGGVWAFPDYPDKPGADSDEDDDEPIAKPTSPFSDRVAQNGASAEVAKNATQAKPKRGRYNYREFTAEEIEQAAANSTSWVETCKELNSSSSGLHRKMTDDPDLKAAYKRGVAMRATPTAAPGKKVGRPMKDESAPPRKHKYPETRKPANGRTIQIDITKVERLGREGLTVKAAAEELGLTVANFKNYIKSGSGKGQIPEARDAWKRGRASAEISNKTAPMKKVVRETVKAKPEPQKVEIVETGQAVVDDTAKESLSFTLSFLGPEGKPIILHELAETLGFNVGNALMHVAADEIEAAIWYLDREKTRRERVNA